MVWYKQNHWRKQKSWKIKYLYFKGNAQMSQVLLKQFQCKPSAASLFLQPHLISILHNPTCNITAKVSYILSSTHERDGMSSFAHIKERFTQGIIFVAWWTPVKAGTCPFISYTYGHTKSADQCFMCKFYITHIALREILQ